MLYLAFTAKLCSTIFFFGAWMSYIPPKHIQNEESDSITNTPNMSNEEIVVYNNNRSEVNVVHF